MSKFRGGYKKTDYIVPGPEQVSVLWTRIGQFVPQLPGTGKIQMFYMIKSLGALISW